MINRVYLEVLSKRDKLTVFKRADSICLPFEIKKKAENEGVDLYIFFWHDLAKWCERNILPGYYYLIEGRVYMAKRKWLYASNNSRNKEKLDIKGLMIVGTAVYKSSRKTRSEISLEEKNMKTNKKKSALITSEYTLLKKDTNLSGFAKQITTKVDIYKKLQSLGITEFEEE